MFSLFLLSLLSLFFFLYLPCWWLPNPFQYQQDWQSTQGKKKSDRANAHFLFLFFFFLRATSFEHICTTLLIPFRKGYLKFKGDIISRTKLSFFFFCSSVFFFSLVIKICFIHLQYNSKCTSFRSLAHNSGNDGPKQYNTHKKRWGYCILDCALLQRSLFVCWTAEIRERLSAFHTKPVILNTRLSIYIYIYTYIDTIYFGLQKKKKWTRAPVFLGFLFFFFLIPLL